VTDLAGGDPRYRDDQGGADPAVTDALTAFAAGTGSEHAVLTALAGSRLLVPVVAVASAELSGKDDAELGSGGEKGSEMAVPAIVGRDGRRALPAFTCLAALQQWQPGARPVPVPAAGVWQSAAEESQSVIIDIAGPVPLAVEGSRLAALASGGPVPRLHEDPDVRAAVAAAAAAQPAGIRIRLGPAHGDADFALELAPAAPAAGRPIPAGVADAIADEVAARLAGRLGLGITVLVRPPGAGA
jgi:SseB protein N-terminal domain